MIEKLHFSVFKIVITFVETSYFTFKDRFEFLKRLEKTIKKHFHCKKEQLCKECRYLLDEQGEVCDYPFLCGAFYPPNYNNIRKPFVILPPVTHREIFDEGEEIEFHLTLIGKASDPNYLIKYFAPAFEALGCFTGIGRGRGKQSNEYPGRYMLSRIYSLDKEDIWKEIFSHNMGFSKINSKIYNLQNLPEFTVNSKLSVGWRTPLYYHINPPLSFYQFWDLVFQRLQPLNFFYGDGTSGDKDEWNKLKDLSCSIKLVKDRYGPVMNYEGNIGPFVPYIIMASYLHIGSQVSSGYGSFFLNAGQNSK